MGRIRYTLLLDCIVKVLKLVRQNHPNNFVSLVFLLEKLDYEANIGEIQEIAKYLEARGFVRALYLLGDVKAQITPTGLVYIEGRGPDFDKEFDQFLTQILQGKPIGEFIESFNEPQDDPQAKINWLIESLASVIGREEGFTSDLIIDLQILKMEIAKFKPDFNIIETKLNNLSTINYIRPEVQELRDYLLIPNS